MKTFEEFRKRYDFDMISDHDHLGDGGFSSVYKAYDKEEDKDVAVKIVRLKNSEAGKYNLETEVSLAKNIKDKTNIAIYDKCYRLESDSGLIDVAVMQYYKDGNLHRYLKNNIITDEIREQIITGLINGLEETHKTIIHRDFKPANILIVVRPDNEVIPKITDFGISKEANLADPNGEISNSMVGGTMSYSSPEQIIRGENSKFIKFNTDLWSLGVIIYEILIGINPFVKNISHELSDDERREKIRAKILQAEIPADIVSIQEPYQSIIRQCLIANPDKRIKTATDVKNLMKELLYKKQLREAILEYYDEDFEMAMKIFNKVPKRLYEPEYKTPIRTIQNELPEYNELKEFINKYIHLLQSAGMEDSEELKFFHSEYERYNQRIKKLSLPRKKLQALFSEASKWKLKNKEEATEVEEITIRRNYTINIFIGFCIVLFISIFFYNYYNSNQPNASFGKQKLVLTENNQNSDSLQLQYAKFDLINNHVFPSELNIFLTRGDLNGFQNIIKKMIIHYPTDSFYKKLLNKSNQLLRIWKFNNGYAWALNKQSQLCVIDNIFEVKKVANDLNVAAWTSTGNWVCINHKGATKLFNSNFVNPGFHYSLYPLKDIIIFIGNDRYFTKQNDRWYLFDETNKKLSNTGFDVIHNDATTFSACGENGEFLKAIGNDDGLVAVSVKQRQGVVDKNGKYVLAPIFEDINFIGADYFQHYSPIITAMKSKDSKKLWGAFNTKGKSIIPISCDLISCSEGICLVKKDNSYQFIKEDGKQLSSESYDDAEMFKNGKAKVKLKGESFYIDKKGNRIP